MPLHVPCPPPPPPRPRRRLVVAGYGTLAVLGIAVFVAVLWCVRADRLADQLRAARAHVERGEWDDARALLEALQDAGGPGTAEVTVLLARARAGQARALLDAADDACRAGNGRLALRLLDDYLAHPDARDRAGAARRRAELIRATDAPLAAALLARLSAAELARFEQDGTLPPPGAPGSAEVAAVSRATLREMVPAEQRRRRDRAALEERLRRSAAFQLLRAYGETVLRRELAELTVGQDRALGQLLAEFAATGEAQADVRARLRGDGVLEARTLLARKQAEAKLAYRRGGNADAAVFDELVDREAERLLADLR